MRTKLCDLKDEDLDSTYVARRDQLKKLVASIIRPKIVQGKTLNGKEFISFLEQVSVNFFFCMVVCFKYLKPFIWLSGSVSLKDQKE